jgi:hypothetical protein
MTESTYSPTAGPTTAPQRGQMTWRLPGQIEPMLHLRLHPLEPWKPYNECPKYMKPDHTYLSPGYATFISLIKQNWDVIK